MWRSWTRAFVNWWDSYTDGTHIAQRNGANFISGDGITISGVDDPTNSRVGITFAATGATTTSGYFNQAGDLLTTFASASGTISFATTTAVGQSLTANDTRIAFDTTTDLILGDNVAVAWGAESDSRLYYDGADTFLNLRNAGSGDLMVALAGSFPSPDTGVHIWRGTAGSIAATAESILVLETPSGQDSWVQFLSPNNRTHMVTNGLVGLALGLVIARGTTSILQPWGNRLRGRRIRRFSRNGRVEQEPSRDPVGIGSG